MQLYLLEIGYISPLPPQLRKTTYSIVVYGMEMVLADGDGHEYGNVDGDGEKNIVLEYGHQALYCFDRSNF